MGQTILQRGFAPVKKLLPRWLWSPIRRAATAALTPLFFSYRTGHLRSSVRGASVDRAGRPIPWYTYPSIAFLQQRDYSQKCVLEFGAGQSTLWWSRRAKHVVALEGDARWYARIQAQTPRNVDLHLVSLTSAEECVADVRSVLASVPPASFDVVIIDGLYRTQMVAIAREWCRPGGMIVCDNAEGYGIWEAFADSGLQRVDFYGNAAGVILTHSTSIYFDSQCFAFDSRLPIGDADTSE